MTTASNVHTSIEHARALVLAELFFMSAALILALCGFHTTISKIIILSTLCFGIALIQIPVLSDFISCTPLHLYDWIFVLCSSIVLMILTKTSR